MLAGVEEALVKKFPFRTLVKQDPQELQKHKTQQHDKKTSPTPAHTLKPLSPKPIAAIQTQNSLQHSMTASLDHW